MPLTFSDSPLYYKDSQGNYHRLLSGADMTGYRTASAQDMIDATQDADIASRAKTDMLGIVINGNSTPVGASVGQYVIVKDSIISGITDGLYTTVKAIPANTAIDSTYLIAVSGGGLNDILVHNLTFTNTLVSSESFTSDQTYANYPYRASIPLNSVTSSFIPEIIFSLEDSTSGIFAPIGETYNGGVYIYATKIPENSITIPTIICQYV